MPAESDVLDLYMLWQAEVSTARVQPVYNIPTVCFDGVLVFPYTHSLKLFCEYYCAVRTFARGAVDIYSVGGEFHGIVISESVNLEEAYVKLCLGNPKHVQIPPRPWAVRDHVQPQQNYVEVTLRDFKLRGAHVPGKEMFRER